VTYQISLLFWPGEPTSEGAFVVEQAARGPSAWERHALMGPDDLPLLRLLCRVITEDAPLRVPWDDLFGRQRVML
jgi:hypothetical protein